MTTRATTSRATGPVIQAQWRSFLTAYCRSRHGEGCVVDDPADHLAIHALMGRLVDAGIVGRDGARYVLPRITPALELRLWLATGEVG